MNITPIIFFDMAAAIIVLAIALIAVVYYLSKVTKTLETNFNMKDENFKKDASLLNDTREKAVKIIDDANNQALDIVSKVTLTTDAAYDNFKAEISHVSSSQIKEFQKTTSDFSKVYSQILQELKMKNVEIFQNVSKDIETNTMKEIGNFRESMQKLTVSAQKEVEEKINADSELSKKEIENYKKEQIEKFDTQIYGMLEKISKLVLGKTLSLSDHENLIQQSLEKAKKEGLFK